MTRPQPRAEFFGRALPLTDGDWRFAATRLRVHPAAVRAVAQQEAMGRRGFLPDGRPLILFEAHKFGYLTEYKYSASHPRLSTTKWDRLLYLGGASEYDRLAAAMRLDRSAALRAASWGMFQIMGFNYADAGHPDVDAFVRAMCDSEGNHLQAFVTLVLKNAAMWRALRRLDWATLALTYNGAGYRKNHYDRNMALYYKRFVGDTAWLARVEERTGAKP